MCVEGGSGGGGGEAEVRGLDYAVYNEGGAGLALAPGAVAGLDYDEGREYFVCQGLAGAVAFEGHEDGGSRHCISGVEEYQEDQWSQDLLGKVEVGLAFMTQL